MKIGVVGVGALGGYYGGKLCRNGANVHLLLRSDFEAVKTKGLQISSPDGDFTVQPHTHASPEAIGKCDLVLVGLKTTANDRYEELIAPLVAERTAILCLQNGLGNCDRLAELFGAEKIMGGLCFVCLNRTAPGVVRHIAFGKIILGEHAGPPRARTRVIAELFKQSGVPCGLAENLEHGLWEKLVWNIPFNGLGVASAAGLEALGSRGETMPAQLGDTLPTGDLLADPHWEQCVRVLMQEIIAVASAKGIALEPELAGRMIDRTRAMGSYRASSVIDFENGMPIELESMFLEPLRRARATGVPVPHLEALCIVLEKLARYLPRP
jgi:2-dehydropantoate 2-reductase